LGSNMRANGNRVGPHKFSLHAIGSSTLEPFVESGLFAP
jgi:hypothetical protein